MTTIVIWFLLFIFFLGIILLTLERSKKEHFQQLVQILSNGDLYWWPKNSVQQNATPIINDPFIGNVQPVYVNCKTHPEMCKQLKTPYLQHQVRYGYNPNAYPNNPTWAY
jgi:hypothetical protein